MTMELGVLAGKWLRTPCKLESSCERAIVRPFEPPDWKEVKAISEQSGLDFDLDPDTTIPVIVELVVCVDGVVAGYPDGDLKLAPDPQTGEIVPIEPWVRYVKNMAVHQAHRRRGLGRKLLLEALAAYREAGCVGVELCTGSDESTAFYRSCGGIELRGSGYVEGSGGSFYWFL